MAMVGDHNIASVDLEEDDAVTEERQNRMDQRTDMFRLVLH